MKTAYRRNPKQNELLAQFYSNFALAWITFGLITPVFVGFGNLVVLFARFIVSLICTVFFLQVGLAFLK